MKKGRVIVGALSHKNRNYVFKEFESITENDVENWDELVKKGYLEQAVEIDNSKTEPKMELKVKVEPKTALKNTR